MKLFQSALCLLSASMLSLSVGMGATEDDPSKTGSSLLLGFNAQGSMVQRSLEQRIDAAISANDLRDWLKDMSSAANHVGAPHNKANAELMQRLFKEWGWDARIETFDVLYPTLKEHRLEMTAPTAFKASLREPPIDSDATSSRNDGLPPYHAFGGDGDVTAPLVYVNYGMPDDYKELARHGVDVKGKIVIARYGAGWRGLKPKLAQEHGALGCIIYSDPRDDGYGAGDVYPVGGYRPAGSVQRGSVMDMPVYPGDPLTPGVGSTKDAKRLSRADAKTILKIPVLPISYSDAQPLLAALKGPIAPSNWRGGLPITYHIGAGPAIVHLMVKSEWSQKTIYDVIATLKGNELPDEWVVRGNHRDAWVFGASDPLSGTVAMLAEAKAIGMQVKNGWKPKRTLIYASWDAEEPGLMGSTEWVETHAQDLQRKAVLYLNSDSNARGFLYAGGSHALQRLVNEVSDNVVDPQTHVPVRERLRASALVEGNSRGASESQRAIAKKVADGGDLPISALGSGSDFSPFLQHLGLNTLNVSYGGEDEVDGVYHSNYDSFDHYSRFGDPGFAYGVAEAQTVARIVLRMTNADVLPMQFANVAETFANYVQELHKLTDDKRRNAEELAKLIDRKAYELASDPLHPIAPPQREPDVPFIELAALDNAVAKLKLSAKAYDEAFAKTVGKSVPLNAGQRAQLNSLLRSVESTLTDSKGLPGREWYRHLVYAPGLLTGYGVKTLPGVRESIEDNQWAVANQYAVLTSEALLRYAKQLDQATAVLHQTSKP